jgi:hypothetical protein
LVLHGDGAPGGGRFRRDIEDRGDRYVCRIDVVEGWRSVRIRPMNPAALSALSALAGSAIGALASLMTTWITQHHQDRVQRKSQEYSRRERLFGDFIVQASKLYADSLTHNKVDPSALVPLYAVKAQLGLFASKETTERADEALRLIIDSYFRPNAEWHDRAEFESKDYDILRAFTEACRRELGG